MAFWVPVTRGAAALGKATGTVAKQGARGVGAAGRKLGGAGVRGGGKAGQAGLKGAGRAGTRGAGAAGRRGAQGAGKGAGAAAQAGKGAKAAKAAKGGLPGLDGAKAKAGGRPKGGWARRALQNAGRSGGGGPAGSGRGGAGSADGTETGEAAGAQPEDAARRRRRRRFRRRRGPLKKSRRRVRWLLTSALGLAAILPLMSGLYGSEAATEAQEIENLARLSAGCGVPPEALSDRIDEELPEELHIPIDALAAYCLAAGAYEDVDWTILAGIGKAECDHGRSQLAGCPQGTVNHCGARGPMQFLGNTWRSGTDPVPSGECPGSASFTGNPVGPPVDPGQEAGGYATDGSGDRVADPWDWRDAAYAAARHLVTNGLKDHLRGALRAYNDSDSYIDGVIETADQYRRVTGELSGGSGTAIVGSCPAGMQRGGSEPITDTRNTEATRAMANAVIACFGRPHGLGCQDPRNGDFEHPRGRACDFMATSGGNAGGEERAWGQAMAEWVAANAEELNVLYVIWYKRSWNPSDGNIPWDQWREYTECDPNCNASSGHYNHVHVSVRLVPGDPAWADCPHDRCSE